MVDYSFLGDSFIRNSMPVYPDAICPFRSAMAPDALLPHRPRRADLLQRVPQARLPSLFQERIVCRFVWT